MHVKVVRLTKKLKVQGCALFELPLTESNYTALRAPVTTSAFNTGELLQDANLLYFMHTD